ncbi:hypothetical protein B0H15DRAFT_844471 [Mycena belliarum]|uniref:Uncharacterized protein n=1 Tax=Mycena belliarum TaxID=1033014 RepID=A0AAD6XLA2_9AGAR|nr:hypothetical protein B0H15DRAFT_844471 [Mycena belliae]
MRTTSLSLVLAASLSNALVNITVDDADAGSSIKFTSRACVTVEPDSAEASWEVSPGGLVRSCHNKTLRRCDEAGATVGFNFTGVAVYLLYPPWPHDMTITATLDSGPPTTLAIPARTAGSQSDAGASSAPVWGISGLPNTQHTLTIGRQEPGGVYVDAFMYTALCESEPCDRRRRKGVGEDDAGEVADAPPPSSSSVIASATHSQSPTSSPPPILSPSSSSGANTATSSPPSLSPSPSASASGIPPTTAISQSDLRRDTIGIVLGIILGIIAVAVALFFAWRRYRRQKPVPGAFDEKSAPPYIASSISSAPISEPTRPPSMRERTDRFSDTHTPAGTPLTGTPASCLTSLSVNSMRLAHLPGPSEKYSPASVNGTSIQDDESVTRFEIPPPEYDVTESSQ